MGIRLAGVNLCVKQKFQETSMNRSYAKRTILRLNAYIKFRQHSPYEPYVIHTRTFSYIQYINQQNSLFKIQLPREITPDKRQVAPIPVAARSKS